ncbi:hypothetical protein DYH10_02650 [Candidatus Saccharibacteria bacterium CPR2]|nr:hypothetical protein [Candidatus Saccharibacteria bacterium CPR2]
MRILVDLDGVIGDIDKAFIEVWKERYPDAPAPEPGTRKEFYIGHEFGDDAGEKAYDIFREKGFFRHTPLMPDAKDALQKMITAGHEVYIVTSAGNDIPYAASDKYQWIDNNFGREWVDRLVITRSKHVVSGDVLIDDKPEVKNHDKANWEHIIFDASYNRHIKNKRRLGWSNWKEVLFP